jgi:hypothetical protein
LTELLIYLLVTIASESTDDDEGGINPECLGRSCGTP